MLHFNTAVKQPNNTKNTTYETNEFNEWKEMNFFDAVKFRSFVLTYVAKFMYLLINIVTTKTCVSYAISRSGNIFNRELLVIVLKLMNLLTKNDNG